MFILRNMTDNQSEYSTITLKFRSFNEAKNFIYTIPTEVDAEVNLTRSIDYNLNVEEDSDIKLCCEWEKYGKGWLLVPEYNDHPHIGTKYYCGGWWMSGKNAWFFRKEAAKKFYEEYEKEYF